MKSFDYFMLIVSVVMIILHWELGTATPLFVPIGYFTGRTFALNKLEESK